MVRLFIVSLLIALASPAAAQVTGSIAPHPPKLKNTVTVANDLVRIGDLVENAGLAADIPVFRSPDLGSTGGVSLARIMEALAPYRIATIETGTITEVMVTRTSRVITPKEIEARIARTLATQYGYGEQKSITITFDRDLRAIHVEPSATEDLQITRLNVEPRTGRFIVAFELPGSTIARRHGLRFSGTALETVEVAVLTRSLNRGEVIKPADLALERRQKADVGADVVNSENAVGLAAKRPLRIGSMLRQDDISKPDVIQRGETVMIVYEAPGFILTSRGKAAEAGSIGDTVNVLNLQSNRTVQATVVGPGRVNLIATPRPTATTAPVPDPQNTPPHAQSSVQ